jgi:hypothetical protein
MKNKLLNTFLVTALAAASIFSCNTPEMIPEIPFDAINYSIVADTSKIKIDKDYKKLKDNHQFSKVLIVTSDSISLYKKPKLPKAPKNKIDLTNLKKDKSDKKDFKMIAIGGGLTAGARDFGYFNEGMYTSYPNLVAQQMTIAKFELPLFPVGEYNGVGRMQKTNINPSGGPLQKFANVKNNGASKGIEETRGFPGSGMKFPILDEYTGDPDNLAYPNMTRYHIREYNPFVTPFYGRIKDKDKTMFEKLKNKDFDFFILESGYDDLLATLTSSPGGYIAINNDLLKGINPNNLDLRTYSPSEWALVRDVISPKKVKGVILNMPDVTKLPIVLSGDLVFKNSLLMYEGSPLKTYGPITKLLPTGQIDSLLSPKVNIALKPGVNRNYPLRSESLLSEYRLEPFSLSKKGFQEQAEILSKQYGYAVVDIATLFDKVLSAEGTVSYDGVRVTAKEFFSLDGMYPSAIGQALIANEVIRTINRAYDMDIPLIAVRDMMD